MVLSPIWLPLAGTVLVARCGGLDGVSLLQVPGSRGAPGDPQPKARRRHGGDGGEAELESSAAGPVLAAPPATGSRPKRGARSLPTVSSLDADGGGADEDLDCHVIVFMGDHFVGNPQRFNVGSYTTAEAERAGLHDDTLSSFIVYGPRGRCAATFYGEDDFRGWRATFLPGHWDLSRSHPQGFVDNDASSLRVERVESTTTSTVTYTIGPRMACSTLLWYGQVWGQSGKGFRVDAQTGGTLGWIGCMGNGCQPDSFYCNDIPGVGMEFGTTDDGPLRALLGNAWPTTHNLCSSAAQPLSISDAMDQPVDVQRLCEQLGYSGGTLLERSGWSSCPEVQWNGTAWTSDFRSSHGHGKRFQCTYGRTTVTTISASSTTTATSRTRTVPEFPVTSTTATSTTATIIGTRTAATTVLTTRTSVSRTTRTHTPKITWTRTTSTATYTTYSYTTSTKTTRTTFTASTATTLTNTTTPTTTTWTTSVTSTTGTTTTTTGPATCSKLQVTYKVWGRPAKGINVGLYTRGLRWIGCVHDAAGAPDPRSCGTDTFFCTDAAGSIEFGTTGPGRLRAMVGKIYAVSGTGCASAASPTDLFNIGVQEEDARYLCAQLGYANATLTAAPDSGHSDECPSIHYAPEVGMATWTSAFAVGTGPFAKTIRCSV